MYENKARLMCTAEVTPFEVLERIVTIADAHNVAPRTSSRSRKNDDFDLCVDNELGFAKDRTISRYAFFYLINILPPVIYNFCKLFLIFWKLKRL